MRKPLLAASLGSLLVLAVAEVGVRLATKAASNGMPTFLGKPLVPFRPTRSQVEGWLEDKSDSSYLAADPELGWTVRPNGSTGLYAANAQAARCEPQRQFESPPPPGSLRIVTVGDSFTHGDELGLEETWQARMEAARDDLEVVNLGVPGYGTDQAILRWEREGAAFQPEVAVLGVYPENICRNLNTVRFYLVPTGSFYPKPRFVLEAGALRRSGDELTFGSELAELLSAPEEASNLRVERWYDPGASRWHWSDASRIARIARSVLELRRRKLEREELYSGRDGTGIELTVALASRFAASARSHGVRPLILIFPMREQLPEANAQPAPSALVSGLREAGLEVVDPTAAFAEVVGRPGGAQIYLPSGHLRVAGNALIETALLAAL